MTNKPERISRIDKTKLDGERYFESLLAEASRVGLLSGEELLRLQYECLALLAERTERYNAGDSSSIRVEKAESILASSLFTVGVPLKACLSPDDAVAALREEPLRELYQRGRRRVGAMILAAKSLHSLLLGKLFETPNVFYRSAIEDAAGGFFKVYDPDYAAQEIHITADYPTFIPVPRLAGIEFIRGYLYNLYNENQFCRFFSPEDVRRRLSRCEEGYEELPINIYQPVLTAALGIVITGGDPRSLSLTAEEAASLQEGFYRLKGEETLAALQKAADLLVKRFACQPSLAAYVRGSAPLLAAEIRSAAKRRMLNRVFFPNT